MGARVPASEQTDQVIEEALASGEQGLRDALQLAVRKSIEETLEAEVSDALGRGYYERGESPARSYRNGHHTAQLKTAEGGVAYSVPQVRGVSFRSQIRPALAQPTEELEELAVGLTRGGSTRDINVTFCDETGRSSVGIGTSCRLCLTISRARFWLRGSVRRCGSRI